MFEQKNIWPLDIFQSLELTIRCIVFSKYYFENSILILLFWSNYFGSTSNVHHHTQAWSITIDHLGHCIELGGGIKSPILYYSNLKFKILFDWPMVIYFIIHLI